MKNDYVSLLITIMLLTLSYIVYYLCTGSLVPCLIHKYTNYYCPTCGITRMFISILKLDFYQAFRFNSYMFCLLLTLPFLILIELLLKNNKYILKKVNISFFIIFLITFFIFGILRNLDSFSYLLPTIVK